MKGNLFIMAMLGLSIYNRQNEKYNFSKRKVHFSSKVKPRWLMPPGLLV